MSKLSLGLESLVPEKISLKGMSPEMMCEISLESMFLDADVNASIEEMNNLCNQAVNINAMIISLEQYGISNQMIELCGLSDITKIQYPKITEANKEEYTAQSVEALVDIFDKIKVAIENAFGKIGDRFTNMVKTLLPFRERYYRKIHDALRDNVISGKVDEAKFGSYRGRGPVKGDWDKWSVKGVNELGRISSQFKSNPVEAVNNLEAFYRSLGFRKDWFTGTPFTWIRFANLRYKKFADLGYKSSDVKKVAKDAVDGLDALEKYLREVMRMFEDHALIERSIGLSLAKRDKDQADASRKQVSEFIVKFRKFADTFVVFHAYYRFILVFASKMVNAYAKSKID